MRTIKYFLPLILILSSVYADEIMNWQTVYQWEDLAGTISYRNDFMKCYIHNSTDMNWAEYQYDAETNTSFANITTGVELKGIYDLRCCDNCYYSQGKMVLAQNSLNYKLIQLNISEPEVSHYYVSEVLKGEYLRLMTSSEGTGLFNFSNYIYFVPVIFIIGLGMFLYVLTESMIGFGVGAGVGLLLGIIFLYSVGVIPMAVIFLFVVVLIIGGILCTRMLF